MNPRGKTEESPIYCVLCPKMEGLRLVFELVTRGIIADSDIDGGLFMSLSERKRLYRGYDEGVRNRFKDYRGKVLKLVRKKWGVIGKMELYISIWDGFIGGVDPGVLVRDENIKEIEVL